MTTITTELAQRIERQRKAAEWALDAWKKFYDAPDDIDLERLLSMEELTLISNHNAASNPVNVIALLDALAAKDKRIADLTASLDAEEKNAAALVHNHRVHAARLIDERGQLRGRIAELEARPEQQPFNFDDFMYGVRSSQPFRGETLADNIPDEAVALIEQALRSAPVSRPEQQPVAHPSHTFRDETAEQAGIDPAIADAYMQGCRDTESRMAEPQPVVTCWSCKNEVEVSAIGDCDGYCPNCNQPIDLDDEPYATQTAAQPVTVNIKWPDDGFDDCLDSWGGQARDTFDCGYNFSATRHEEAIRAALAAAGITIAEGE